MFSALYSRVFKISANKKKYYEAVNKFISTLLSSRDVLPSDVEFEFALTDSDIYSNHALCKFLLTDIENGDSREVLQADSLTIEHIMPQRLSPEWKRIITDEEHDRYINVLGNLTITGYNSELSNKNFQEKKAVIHQYSKAVILNADVLDKSSWTVRDIQAKSVRLAGIVAGRYSVEKINDPSLVFDDLTKITLDNDPADVTSTTLDAFIFEGMDYKQNRFAYMLTDIVKILAERFPETLKDLAAENYSFLQNGTRSHITQTPENLKRPQKIRQGIFIETSLSSEHIMMFIKSLFERFGVNKNSFYILIKTPRKNT